MSELKPGRELDALVAEKVFGWRREQRKRWAAQDPTPFFVDIWVDDAGRERSELPNFSEAIAAAWEVVEKIKKNVAGWFTLHDLGDGWMAGWGLWTPDPKRLDIKLCADGSTAPHAICLAALKAVGWKGEE